MPNLLEILEWDSRFFGYTVAKINAAEIHSEKLGKIIEEAKNKKIRLIYLFADPADTVSLKSADINGARLVDQKITFHIKIDDAVASKTDASIEQFERSYPTSQLISLSLQSGIHSRFKTDTEFKNNEFEKLYLAWIENSVNKRIADYTLVYMEDAVELGFVTLRIKGDYGEIGLIAVDEKSRGKAIGMKLTAAVINLLHERNITDLHVATQLGNTLACNFYKKAGFTGIKTENIYHIWL